MRKIAYVLVVTLLIIAGCGGGEKPEFSEEQMDYIPPPQRTNLPPASGGFVIAVGEETITADQIIEPLLPAFAEVARQNDFETFIAQTAPKINDYLTTQISNILLYQMAKKDAAESIDEILEAEAEKRVREFIVSFKGDYAKAEQELKRMGMDWEKFKEYQKRVMMSQSYISSQLPEDISPTHSELLEYYDDVKDTEYITPASLRFWLIDIMPEKFEGTKDEKYEKAKELAMKVFKEIENGADFAEMAKKYSHGHKSQAGGKWKAISPDSLASPYDILAVAAERTEHGNVVGPIDVKNHFFIMKLIEKKGKNVQTFEQVQNQIEAKMSFAKRRKAIDDLGLKLVQQAAIGNKGPFIAYCARRIYEIANE
ncbi:MAG: hypothetical protein FVQ80_00210 [Planctomycetes bacterium]|nr:hypothetical protein [Planctomycetota bacterium]